ncbi:hypothetical protein FKM82_014430 [Ascaphus truei]
MHLLLVSVCLFILGSSAGASPEPHYVVTVPAQMSHPSMEKACVIFLGLKGELSLRMKLQRGNSIQLVAEEKIDTPNYSHCYSFQLPPITEEQMEVWLFHVLGQGENLNINQTKKVLIGRIAHVTFIQTDKPMYKPGQSVKFRVVTMDKDFHVQNDTYPMVKVLDPNGNRIGQWLNVTPTEGIADFSFPLAAELPLGDYVIEVPNQKTTFSVSEYVLKRFEVNFNVPPKVSHTDESFKLEACGSYTYGKPVRGSMDLSVCLIFYEELEEGIDSDSCQRIHGVETDNSGCISREIDLQFYNFSSSDNFLIISSSLTENSTGVVENQSTAIFFSNRASMEFVDIDSYYQMGIPFSGMINAVDQKGESMQNKTVFLVVNIDEVDTNFTLVTDEKGLAHFTLDTSQWNDMVSLRGKFSLEEAEKEGMYSHAFLWLYPFYSESNSFLKVQTIVGELPCDTKQPITVEYIIDKKELDPADDHLSFFYIVLAKARIVSNGEFQLNVREHSDGPTLQGSFTLLLPVNIYLIPTATLLIFTVFPDGEVVADRARYSIPTCFSNKVELNFSEKKVRPGGKVSLELRADSGSLCSVRAVDKGVLLHQSHKKTTLPTELARWMNMFSEINKRGFPYTIEDFERYPCLETDPGQNSRSKRSKLWAPWYQSEADVYSLFKESSLKVFTNTKIRKPVTCKVTEATRRISLDKKLDSNVAMTDSKANKESQKPSIRKFFPETWLYDLVSVGLEGRSQLNLTTPHSITEWVTDAFCLGHSGFGEAHEVSLTTFKPYFIDLMLPHSVVHREEFQLKALVFNYLKQCMLVVVALSDSEDFTADQNRREQHSCICEDETASFMWNVTATKMGIVSILVSSGALQLEGACTGNDLELGKKRRGDALEKTLLVKPGGVLEEKTQTNLLCPKGDVARADVSLKFPDRVISGSEYAHITVLGDIMGNAMAHVGKNLVLPFGCGEQNMVKFAPNIYILQYLQNSKQLTPELRDKAVKFLTTGYQRQLMFKHDNGTYSAFGKKDKEGNTWLTAFVIRSFNQAQEFIHINNKHIQDAVRWLSSLQLSNGCFQSVGKLFNNKLKNEEDDEVTLAAYITIALLEHRTVYNDSMVENALSCLRDAADKVNSTYSQALLAYVFTLSGDNNLRQHMLEILEKKAIRKDASEHWALDSSEESSLGGVEISSYVLLALLSGPAASEKDIEKCSCIVSWVVKQSNPYGGFHSTQDTVVALQALAKYAGLTFREKEDVTVTVRSLPEFQEQFHVDQRNRLLLQRATLSEIPRDYIVTATGSGCVYVQTHLKYHIPPAKTDTHFSLTVSTRPQACTMEAETSFEILVEVSYSGNRISSNMVVVDVELLSGFSPIKTSLKKLEKNPLVKRTEFKEEKVLIYLEELTHETERFALTIKQETLVKNLQPANVLVYDYYDPEEHAVAEYNSPCSTGPVKEGAQ